MLEAPGEVIDIGRGLYFTAAPRYSTALDEAAARSVPVAEGWVILAGHGAGGQLRSGDSLLGAAEILALGPVQDALRGARGIIMAVCDAGQETSGRPGAARELARDLHRLAGLPVLASTRQFIITPKGDAQAGRLGQVDSRGYPDVDISGEFAYYAGTRTPLGTPSLRSAYAMHIRPPGPGEDPGGPLRPIAHLTPHESDRARREAPSRHVALATAAPQAPAGPAAPAAALVEAGLAAMVRSLVESSPSSPASTPSPGPSPSGPPNAAAAGADGGAASPVLSSLERGILADYPELAGEGLVRRVQLSVIGAVREFRAEVERVREGYQRYRTGLGYSGRLIPVDSLGNCFFDAVREMAGEHLAGLGLFDSAGVPSVAQLRKSLVQALRDSYEDYRRHLGAADELAHGLYARRIPGLTEGRGEEWERALLERYAAWIGADGTWNADEGDNVVDIAAHLWRLPLTALGPRLPVDFGPAASPAERGHLWYTGSHYVGVRRDRGDLARSATELLPMPSAPRFAVPAGIGLRELTEEFFGAFGALRAVLRELAAAESDRAAKIAADFQEAYTQAGAAGGAALNAQVARMSDLYQNLGDVVREVRQSAAQPGRDMVPGGQRAVPEAAGSPVPDGRVVPRGWGVSGLEGLPPVMTGGRVEDPRVQEGLNAMAGRLRRPWDRGTATGEGLLRRLAVRVGVDRTLPRSSTGEVWLREGWQQRLRALMVLFVEVMGRPPLSVKELARFRQIRDATGRGGNYHALQMGVTEGVRAADVYRLMARVRGQDDAAAGTPGGLARLIGLIPAAKARTTHDRNMLGSDLVDAHQSVVADRAAALRDSMQPLGNGVWWLPDPAARDGEALQRARARAERPRRGNRALVLAVYVDPGWRWNRQALWPQDISALLYLLDRDGTWVQPDVTLRLYSDQEDRDAVISLDGWTGASERGEEQWAELGYGWRPGGGPDGDVVGTGARRPPAGYALRSVPPVGVVLFREGDEPPADVMARRANTRPPRPEGEPDADPGRMRLMVAGEIHVAELAAFAGSLDGAGWRAILDIRPVRPLSPEQVL
jgi:hypothetical protein